MTEREYVCLAFVPDSITGDPFHACHWQLCHRGDWEEIHKTCYLRRWKRPSSRETEP